MAIASSISLMACMMAFVAGLVKLSYSAAVYSRCS